MAPEQMQPGEQLDARADIYALGTIAYHMLGGRPPFTGNITQLIAQKLTQAPPALSSLRSDVSAEVEASIMKALAKEANDRPATASEWFESFAAAVSTSSETVETRRFATRHHGAVGCGSLRRRRALRQCRPFGSSDSDFACARTTRAARVEVRRAGRRTRDRDSQRHRGTDHRSATQDRRLEQSTDAVARRQSRQQARRTLDDAGGRDVHEVPFAFCGRSEVLRPVRQHDVSTSFR